jgi:23S rRNA pseudouridine1911/1915/1917 synthase
MEPKILFEDDQVLAIDKPAGLIVNRANSVKDITVQDWLEKTKKIGNGEDSDFGKRNGIVHRIDKETSGVLLVGKTEEAFEELQRQFKAREVEKTYCALVHGSFDLGSGIIKAPIGRLPWNRERFGILAGGRESETIYKVIKPFTKQNKKQIDKFSLVEFYPKTGRTHQIRVHAKYINHPLVSDSFYAGRKTSRRDREWCQRLFLHAKEIVFTHPVSKERIKVTSKLSEDLEQALSTLSS